MPPCPIDRRRGERDAIDIALPVAVLRGCVEG
jgi:hypothetical protein